MPCIQLEQVQDTDEQPVRQATVYNPASASVMEIWSQYAPEGDLAQLERLSQIVGVQEYSSLAFQMRMKTPERNFTSGPEGLGLNDAKEIDHVTREPLFHELSLTIAMVEVPKAKLGTMSEWFDAAVESILNGSDWAPIPTEYYGKREMGFELQRRASSIARATRRGLGNTLVATTKALSYFPAEVLEAFVKRRGKIIEVPDTNEKPSAMIGYVGTSKYDAGLLLSLSNQPTKNGKYFGAFAGSFDINQIHKYWKRMI